MILDSCCRLLTWPINIGSISTWTSFKVRLIHSNWRTVDKYKRRIKQINTAGLITNYFLTVKPVKLQNTSWCRVTRVKVTWLKSAWFYKARRKSFILFSWTSCSSQKPGCLWWRGACRPGSTWKERGRTLSCSSTQTLCKMEASFIVRGAEQQGDGALTRPFVCTCFQTSRGSCAWMRSFFCRFPVSLRLCCFLSVMLLSVISTPRAAICF